MDACAVSRRCCSWSSLATVVATFARRIPVPAPSLLVVAGVAVAPHPGHAGDRGHAGGGQPGRPAAAAVRRRARSCPGASCARSGGRSPSSRSGWCCLAAAAVGACTVWTTALPASLAFVLGAVLASTDPVAVAALGRRLSLPPRLQTLVQAESLFNDATSLILFRVSLGVAVAGGAIAWGHAVGRVRAARRGRRGDRGGRRGRGRADPPPHRGPGAGERDRPGHAVRWPTSWPSSCTPPA